MPGKRKVENGLLPSRQENLLSKSPVLKKSKICHLKSKINPYLRRPKIVLKEYY